MIGLCKVHWKSIECPSKVHLRSIKGPSKVHQRAFEGPSKVHWKKSTFLQSVKSNYFSIFGRCDWTCEITLVVGVVLKWYMEFVVTIATPMISEVINGISGAAGAPFKSSNLLWRWKLDPKFWSCQENLRVLTYLTPIQEKPDKNQFCTMFRNYWKSLILQTF